MGQAHMRHIAAKHMAPDCQRGKRAKIEPKGWRPKSSAKAGRAQTNWIDRVVNRIDN